MLGFKLGHLPLEIGQQLIGFIHELVRNGLAEPARSLLLAREQIDDADRIRVLVGTLMSTGGLGIHRNIDAPIKAEQFTKEDGKDAIYWKAPAEWGEPPYLIDMAGYNSIHRLTFDSVTFEGGRARTGLPSHIERVRHRWYRRCVVREPTWISFRHPLWPELSIGPRKLRDISYAGLCFETILEEDLAFPGLDLSQIIITTEGLEPITLTGQVRFVSLGRHDDSPLCGMMIAPATPEDEQRWLRVVSRELHANTKSGTEWSESIWSLFENSGYFNLSGKSPEQFKPLKASFITFGERAASAPRLLCQSVWPSQRGIEASVSLLKAYRTSWLGHQLAKRAGRPPDTVDPRQILRDIYVRAHEHPQSDPQFSWIIGYVEAQVPWIQRAHIEFALKHASTGLALTRPFRLMEAASSKPAGETPPDVEIGYASFEERAILINYLRETKPKVYLESVDLEAESFDLSEIRGAWREAGFERDRTVVVARRHGEMIAAAILESGETGTNLFRLLDGVRLIPIEPGSEAAAAGLLNEARRWYHSKGKETFVYFHENRAIDIRPAQLLDLGEGHFWVISAMLLPEFLEHIYELTAPKQR
jgi:hypothetical protein